MPDHVPDDGEVGATSRRGPAEPEQDCLPEKPGFVRKLSVATPIITLVALLAAATTLATFCNSSPREPGYAGKTISEWLDGGYEPAAMALQEVGPPAIPWVFRNLRREHAVWSKKGAYLKLQCHVPARFWRMFPTPKRTGFDELRAANLLIGLGPSAVPALRAGLKDSNPAVRTACAMALSNLAPKPAGEPRPAL